MFNPNIFTQRHIYQQNKTLIKYFEVQNPLCKNKTKQNPHSIHFWNTYYVLGTVLENKEMKRIKSISSFQELSIALTYIHFNH